MKPYLLVAKRRYAQGSCVGTIAESKIFGAESREIAVKTAEAISFRDSRFNKPNTLNLIEGAYCSEGDFGAQEYKPGKFAKFVKKRFDGATLHYDSGENWVEKMIVVLA